MAKKVRKVRTPREYKRSHGRLKARQAKQRKR